MNRDNLRGRLHLTLISALGMGLVLALLRLLGDSSPLVAGASVSVIAPYVVDVTTDEVDGDCLVDCSLRDAIILANGNGQTDHVILGADTYTLAIAGINEDAATTGDLDITAPLTIIGAGPESTFIDARGIDRVFDVRPGAGQVTISGVTVLNGYVNTGAPGYYPRLGCGGGIYNAGADLVLTNTVVYNNSCEHSRAYGGGIYVGSGSVSVSGGQVLSNNAVDGGGVYVVGAVTFDGGKIRDNTAANWGGGVYVASGSATVQGRLVVDSNTADRGGGVYVASGSATLGGAWILGNSAASYGGGLYLGWSSGDIAMTSGCIVSNTDTSVVNGSFGALAVTNVWWGVASGPAGMGSGEGDSVGTSVTYLPFSKTANGCPWRYSAFLPIALKAYSP